MISEAQLLDLEQSFKDRFPIDSEITQLGLRLVSEVRKSRQTLVSASIPLEVLAGQIRHKPYSELSTSFQDTVLEVVGEIEQTLECHDSIGGPSDINDEIAVWEIDPDALTESEAHREYFECPLNGEQHIFKFTLDAVSGEFVLHTFTKPKIGFVGRIVSSLNYIFGGSMGRWNIVTMDRCMTERLHRLTNEALDVMSAKASRTLNGH